MNDQDSTPRHDDARNRDSNAAGLVKYGIAWLLGVPLSLLLVILLFARGC